MHASPTVAPSIRSSADVPTVSTPAEVPDCPAARIAQQAAREATRAADTAMRAAARSTAANSARLDTIMFEAHQAATDAERYARLAAEEERAGNPATGRNFTALAIARAVDAQRTAGVPCTAEALAALIERQRTEAEIQEEARAERERDAAYEAEQRATTGMDADNRVRLEVAKSTARQEVPSWGWSRGMLRAMEVAQAGKLYRRDGYAWQSRTPGQFTGGRRVARERVLMLASAGFLAVGRGADRAITVTSMGETALYLAQLHPDGLHPDDRTAHQARLAAGRRRGRSREEVKAAARRLRPLDRHVLRSFKRPVPLAEQNARAALEAEQTWESEGGAVCEPADRSLRITLGRGSSPSHSPTSRPLTRHARKRPARPDPTTADRPRPSNLLGAPVPARRNDTFPPLPLIEDPLRLVTDDPAWAYTSTCAGGGGTALLRVWRTADGGHLAIVTQSVGPVSITNAAEEITAALISQYPGPLVILEHYRAGDGAPHDRLDQVLVRPGRGPEWKAVWPIPPANPNFETHQDWMRQCGATLLSVLAR